MSNQRKSIPGPPLFKIDINAGFHLHVKSFLYRDKASFTHLAKHILVKITVLPILDFLEVM